MLSNFNIKFGNSSAMQALSKPLELLLILFRSNTVKIFIIKNLHINFKYFLVVFKCFWLMPTPTLWLSPDFYV